MQTVKMSATALRAIMGETFDGDMYERGRQEAREFFKKYPEKREAKIEEIKRNLEYGVIRILRAVLLDRMPLRIRFYLVKEEI